MKIESIYVADDGTVFDNEKDCLFYESKAAETQKVARYLTANVDSEKKRVEYDRVLRDYIFFEADKEEAPVEEPPVEETTGK